MMVNEFLPKLDEIFEYPHALYYSECSFFELVSLNLKWLHSHSVFFVK